MSCRAGVLSSRFIGSGHLVCLQVHVSMHGQEALFTENMTLKEVIERFKEQQLVTASTLENERTHLPISQDRVLATGECQGGIEKGCCVGITS